MVRSLYARLKPLLLPLLVLAAATASAQPGSGGPTPTQVPVDGGVSLLLAAGAAYGLKRLRKPRC